MVRLGQTADAASLARRRAPMSSCGRPARRGTLDPDLPGLGVVRDWLFGGDDPFGPSLAIKGGGKASVTIAGVAAAAGHQVTLVSGIAGARARAGPARPLPPGRRHRGGGRRPQARHHRAAFRRQHDCHRARSRLARRPSCPASRSTSSATPPARPASRLAWPPPPSSPPASDVGGIRAPIRHRHALNLVALRSWGHQSADSAPPCPQPPGYSVMPRRSRPKQRMALPRRNFQISSSRQAGLGADVGGDLLAVRERAVGVRVVGLEADLVHADEVAVAQADLVVEHAAVDAVVEVARRLVREVGAEGVVAPLGPQLVGPLEHVGHPADLALGVRRSPGSGSAPACRRRCSRASSPWRWRTSAWSSR